MNPESSVRKVSAQVPLYQELPDHLFKTAPLTPSTLSSTLTLPFFLCSTHHYDVVNVYLSYFSSFPSFLFGTCVTYKRLHLFCSLLSPSVPRTMHDT